METTFRSDERFTQAEFARWLDKHGGMLTGSVELIEGAIVMAPPAYYPHSRLVTRLVAAIENHVRPRNLGQVHAPSAGYEFRSGDTLEPDVSFLSTACLQKGPAPRSPELGLTIEELFAGIDRPRKPRPVFSARDLS